MFTANSTTHKKRFVSQPHDRRSGQMPLFIAIAVGCFIDILGFIAAFGIFDRFPSYAPLYGTFIITTACILGGVLAFAVYRLIRDSHRRYELTIDGDDVELLTFETRGKKRGASYTAQFVPLRDVTRAEYYPAEDTSTIILHGDSGALELPLWSFTPHAERLIVQQLRNSGVTILNMPAQVII